MTQKLLPNKQKIIVIFGPTVTGKTSLALKLAKKIDGQIISADSRQIYKGLDIGSGKVGFESQVHKGKGYWKVEGVIIHGFDIVNPEEKFSAYDFAKFGRDKISSISASGKIPIIAGGSGFYIKSLIYGIGSVGIEPNSQLRNELESMSTDKMFEILKKMNKKRAYEMNNSDKSNPRRLIRAIEIEKSKTKTSTGLKPLEAKTLFIGLTAPNSILFQKADRWLVERLEKGLTTEIKGLLKMTNIKWLENLGLEYKWITLYLLKKQTKENSTRRLKRDIHNLIRKQKTWFRQFKNLKKFDITNESQMKELQEQVNSFIK